MKQRNQHRRALTQVAVICDSRALHLVLPQFIIGNEHNVRKVDLDLALGFLLPNVYLLRQKSGWADTAVFCQILYVLEGAILTAGLRCRMLLLLDAGPVRLHPLCLQAAHRLSVRLRVIPMQIHLVKCPVRFGGSPTCTHGECQMVTESRFMPRVRLRVALAPTSTSDCI